MRIAVNTRLLIGNRLDGIGIFTRETMRRIVRDHPEHQFLFLFDRPPSSDYIFGENVEPIVCGPVVREPITALIWQELQLPRILRREKANLLFSPEPMHSLRAKLPKVEVVHDLNYEHEPEYLPPIWRAYYNIFSKRYARDVSRLVTVSDYSKKDIVNLYQIPEEKIDVVYNGAPDIELSFSSKEVEAIRRKYTAGNPYFYFVGTLHQRKNIVGMLRAFDQFKKNDRKNVQLVIVGRKKWWNREMESTWREMKNQESVVFAGRLEDDELKRVAGGSIGLLYVPFFEGFGIPILEAFSVHVPVIAANVTSMPEVAGEGGLLVDPHSVEEISEAMTQLATDPKLREQLIEKGKSRRKLFTWERTASLLWQSFEQVLREVKKID
ncbi:MAG: glycosyltransferase family 4 protein [Ignavibacteriae bacterium]|nr:glycosyltransferase family 4 protein [Ignavibacteriota bacterium]MCB9216645.1 glycosyltransferase family 4 protein [Ignavibacteria bacterium]